MATLISHPYEVNPYRDATVAYEDGTSKLIVLGQDRKTGDVLVFSHGDDEAEDKELYRGCDYRAASASYENALNAESKGRVIRGSRDKHLLADLIARDIQSSRSFNESNALRAQAKADRIKGRLSYHLNEYIFGR